MPPGPETRLVGRIRAAIRKERPDAWIIKTHGNPYQQAGLPDLLVLTGGTLVALEVKCQQPGESDWAARSRVTTLQRVTLDAIERAGGVAAVVLTVEEALDALPNTI